MPARPRSTSRSASPRTRPPPRPGAVALPASVLGALGHFSESVHHKLSNPLGALLAFIEMMQREPGRTPADLSQLGELEACARRIQGIAGQLQTIASEETDSIPLALSGAVRAAAEAHGARAQVHRRAETSRVVGNPELLRQGLDEMLRLIARAGGSVELRLEPGPGRTWAVHAASLGAPRSPAGRETRPQPPLPLGLVVAARAAALHRGTLHRAQGPTLTLLLPAA